MSQNALREEDQVFLGALENHLSSLPFQLLRTYFGTELRCLQGWGGEGKSMHACQLDFPENALLHWGFFHESFLGSHREMG